MLDRLAPWVGRRCRIRSRVREEVEWDYWTCLVGVAEVGGRVWCRDSAVAWVVVEDGLEVEEEVVTGTWDFRPLAEVYKKSRNWNWEA